MAKRKKNPEGEVHELILYAENTYSLHNQFTSIIKNLQRKAKRGIYDKKKAAKLWQYWIDEAVKSYNKEFLTGNASLVQNVFTIADRRQAAKEIEAQERDEIFRGDNPVRKRRTKAQIAATKKLVALNKKRRGKKTVRKTRKKRRTPAQIAATKKLVRLNKMRVGKAASRKRRKNPKRTTKAKSHLWFVFKCQKSNYGTGQSTRYLGVTKTGKLKFGSRSEMLLWQIKSVAVNLAKLYANTSNPVGVASASTTGAQIMARCQGKA